jgi:hypothetical protein
MFCARPVVPMNLFRWILPILATISQFTDSGNHFVLGKASYARICRPWMCDVALPFLSQRETLKESMQIILIHLSNHKTSRKGNISNNCQTFGEPTRDGCESILWQTTIDEAKPSTTPFRPDESRFELVPAPPFPQVDHTVTSTECADMD